MSVGARRDGDRRSQALRGCLLAVLALGVLGLGIGSGCRHTQAGLLRRQGQVALPTWFTQPSGPEQSEVPVSLGMVLPSHLEPLRERYTLPAWLVYGVVRALGSTEFLVNGTVRTFSVRDELGESEYVVDKVYYDVPLAQVEATLGTIAAQCGRAENELERHNVLGSYVVRRHGSFVLFSLVRTLPLGQGDANGAENLLLTSGVDHGPVEVFSGASSAGELTLGWRETGSDYIATMAGTFRYADPIGAFRRAEEDAIQDLAKGLVLKFSHMRKQLSESVKVVTGDISEETLREEIRLRMRGVRVTRRIVNLDEGLCLVEVRVPRAGVALR